MHAETFLSFIRLKKEERIQHRFTDEQTPRRRAQHLLGSALDRNAGCGKKTPFQMKVARDGYMDC
jgi:hypothetical protein